jgi:hypothetical protein
MRRKPLDPRLCFPWQGSPEKWSRKWIGKHFWRVRHVLCTPEDALQQCAMVYVRVVNKYAETVDNRAWMMSLYMRAIMHEWHTLSDRDTASRDFLVEMPEDPAQAGMLEPCEVGAGPLAAALAGASAELREALTLALNAPAELFELIFGRDQEKPDDALVNRRWRRSARITRDVDLLAELREMLE